MPFDRSKYPADWEAIRQRILARAENRCERCGVPNHSTGSRDKHGKWWNEKQIERMNSDIGYELWPDGFPAMIKIVLTIAHLNHSVLDNRDENLAGLCQKCHLFLDKEQHLFNSFKTRERKKGQSTMLELLGIKSVGRG